MNVLAITQARTGSTRLPNKVLLQVAGKSLLRIQLERILRSKRINGLLVATTVEPNDAQIVAVAESMNLPVYRGSVANVLDRFYQAAKPYRPSWVVRLTSDCPLIDPALLDDVILTALEKEVDYCANTLKPSFPDGQDIEVFKFSALEKAWREATSSSDKEHVTPYIYNNSSFYGKDLFSAHNFSGDGNYGQVRLTVDEPADFQVIRLLVEKLGTEKGWQTYADFYLSDEQIAGINRHIQRNEGYKDSSKK